MKLYSSVRECKYDRTWQVTEFLAVEICWPGLMSNPILPLQSAKSFRILLPHGHLHSHRVICMILLIFAFDAFVFFVFLTVWCIWEPFSWICRCIWLVQYVSLWVHWIVLLDLFLTKRCIWRIQYIGLCGVHRRAAKGSDTALRASSGSNAYWFLQIYDDRRRFFRLLGFLYFY